MVAELPTTTTLQDVSDKLLRLILKLLTVFPLCLVHAAATCKWWRRLVADDRLLKYMCFDVG
jgi:hypothetical protein